MESSDDEFLSTSAKGWGEPFGERRWDYSSEEDDEDVGYHSGHTASRVISDTEEEYTSTGSLTPRNRTTSVHSTPQRTRRKERAKDLEEDQDEWEEPKGNDFERGYESAEGENYFSESDRAPPSRKGTRANANFFASQDLEEQRRMEEMWLQGMPKGYEIPTLGRLVKTGLTYRDLLWDSKRKTVASVFTKEGTTEPILNFQVTLVEARDIPLPAGDVTVLSRKLRVVLWNEGSSENPFVSNIHTTTASWSTSRPKLWQFPSSRGVWSPRKHENVFLVRSGETLSRQSLLFELCVVFRKDTPNGPPQYGEVSCGWCSCPINTRAQRERNRELLLKGGKVFQDIPFEAPVAFAGGILKKRPGPPTLVLRMSEVNRETNSFLRKLPTTIIVSATTCPLAMLYRMVQADMLLHPFNPMELPSAAPLAAPELVSFLDILDNGDLLEVFKTVWENVSKGFTASQRDSWTYKKETFIRVCFRVWPLMFVADLPTGNDGQAAAQRFEFIRQFILPENSLLQFLNSKEHFFHPFTPTESLFDPAMGTVLQNSSVSVPPLTSSRPSTALTFRPSTSSSKNS